MKNLLLLASCITLLAITFSSCQNSGGSANQEPTNGTQPTLDFSNFQGCFQLEESEGSNKAVTFISLKISGNDVTGEQAVEITGVEYNAVGAGTIKGARSGDVLNVIYDYEIEGSAQKEEQEFKITATALMMTQSPLDEVNGVLVPKNKGLFNRAIPKIDCP